MRHIYIPIEATSPRDLPIHLQTVYLHGDSMGTTWSAQLIGDASLSPVFLQQGLQEKLDQVDSQMSTWDVNSDLCRFNHASAGTWHQLPSEFCQVLDYAIYLARQTTGAYDPAAGKLVDLWGFGPCARKVDFPDPDSISKAMSGSGWRDLKFEAVTGRLLQAGGISLDFSSIAKGYAVDQMARFLDAQNVVSYLIEVGGELRGAGIKPDHSPWWVNIERPDSASLNEQPEHMVALHDLSIATSGNYRQFFEYEGKRYSHTIDSRTGYPVDNHLLSVSVLHRECMVADALATAFTVMGSEAALAYANQHQIAAIFFEQEGDTISEKLSAVMAAMRDE
ncbi:FAD:protein FMN transferase [Undibacterium sp. Ji67W]|uniref:FAD:protein FMN transferase n=1 Tax=Undibacterium sp. Ji67W TaxID=3413042 RepID=UPI003BF24732